MSLCDAEKTFILHNVAENLRTDGRDRLAYRPMELQTNAIIHAYGSARLKLGTTHIIAATKLEMDTPSDERPCEGNIEFFVEYSANVKMDVEDRESDASTTELIDILQSAYESNSTIDKEQLCIVKRKKCWTLYVDIMILENGGNLYDAVSLAVKAALINTAIPKIKSISFDGNNIELDISDEIDDCTPLPIVALPNLITLAKIGNHFVVDTTVEEEECSQCVLLVAICNDRILTAETFGKGCLCQETLLEGISLSRNVAKSLDTAFSEAIDKIKSLSSDIFLT